MPGRTEADIVAGLLDVCRDAARGFRLAADLVSDRELKRIFSDAARRRDLFAAELLLFAHSGGEGTITAVIHRGWMNMKDTLTAHDDGAVLTEAIRGEEAAADAYHGALASMLPPKSRPIIQRHLDEIRGLLEDLKVLALPCM